VWSRTSSQAFARLISTVAAVHIFPVSVHRRMMIADLVSIVSSVITAVAHMLL